MREAVELPSEGTIRIELNGVVSARLPSVLDPSTPDHRLLACCLNLVDAGDPPGSPKMRLSASKERCSVSKSRITGAIRYPWRSCTREWLKSPSTPN